MRAPPAWGPLDGAFVEHARLLDQPVLDKKLTGRRIDADVLDWFMAQG